MAIIQILHVSKLAEAKQCHGSSSTFFHFYINKRLKYDSIKQSQNHFNREITCKESTFLDIAQIKTVYNIL
jgi:hypothetical protein